MANTHLINWSDNINDYETLQNIPISIVDNKLEKTNVSLTKNSEAESVVIQVGDSLKKTIKSYFVFNSADHAFLDSIAGDLKVNNIVMKSFQTIGSEIGTTYSYGWYSSDMVLYRKELNWILGLTTALESGSYILEAKTAVVKPEYEKYLFNIHKVIDDNVSSTMTAYSSEKVSNVINNSLKSKVDVKEGFGLSQCNFTPDYVAILTSITRGSLGIDDINMSASTTYSSSKIECELKNIKDLSGKACGFASLDANCKVPASQLPSYVDDIVEGTLSSDKLSFTVTTQDNGIAGTLTYDSSNAVAGKIYVNITDNKTYRWSGTQFIEISQSLAIGTTASTAYKGLDGFNLCNRVTQIDNTISQTNTYLTNAIGGYNSPVFSNVRTGSKAYGSDLSCYSGCYKPYSLQQQIIDATSISTDSGKYFSGFASCKCNDSDIGDYDKIVPTYTAFDTTITSSSKNAPTAGAVYKHVNDVCTGIDTKIKTCIESLDAEGVNSGNSGYINCISETNGKICASCNSFITNIASSASSSIAPSTSAVVSFVSSCITEVNNTVDGLNSNNVGSAGKFISAVSQSKGKVSASATDFINCIANNLDSNIAPSAKAVACYTKERINTLNADPVSQSGHYLSGISETSGIISACTNAFITCIAEQSESDTAPTTNAVKTYVTEQINSLNADCKGGDNKYIKSILQSNGKITATESDLVTNLLDENTVFTCSVSTDPVTAGAVSNVICSLKCENNTSSSGYICSLSQTDGKISYSTQCWASNVDESEYPATSVAVKSYIDDGLSCCRTEITNDINCCITTAISSCCASTGKFGTVKIGSNICVANGVISTCPFTLNFVTSGATNNGAYISPNGAMSLHDIARTGLTAFSADSDGNVITSISPNNSSIIICCGYFANADTKGCANAAKKLVKSDGSNLTYGSSIQPVYFSNGVPACTCKIETNVPENACIPTSFGSCLSFADGQLSVIDVISEDHVCELISAATSCVQNGNVSSATNASCAANATTANCASCADILNCNANMGSATCPIYFSDGVPMKGAHFLCSNVPESACIPTMIGQGLCFNNSCLYIPDETYTPFSCASYISGLVDTGTVKACCAGYADSADVATCVGTTDVGSSIKPIYVCGGVLTEAEYALNSNVPENACIPTSLGSCLTFTNGKLNVAAEKFTPYGCAAKVAKILNGSCTVCKAVHSTCTDYWGSESSTCGSSIQPIYLLNGVPACTCTIQTNVPANAVIPTSLGNCLYLADDGTLDVVNVISEERACELIESAKGAITGGTVSSATYASCASCAATATTACCAACAAALTSTSVGNGTCLVYFNDKGVPTKGTYSLSSSVPANAKIPTNLDSYLCFNSTSKCLYMKDDAYTPYNCAACVTANTNNISGLITTGTVKACNAGHADSADNATCATNAEYAANATCATCATNATTASKIGSSTVGCATQPVYICNGIPTAGTHNLCSDVPADAKIPVCIGRGLTLNKSGCLYVTSDAYAPYGCAAQVETNKNNISNIIDGTTKVGCAEYADSADIATCATTATCIGSGSKGCATQPVYICDGIPTMVTHSLCSDVPANACIPTELGNGLEFSSVTDGEDNITGHRLSICYSDICNDSSCSGPARACDVASLFANVSNAVVGATIYYCEYYPDCTAYIRDGSTNESYSSCSFNGNRPAIIFYSCCVSGAGDDNAATWISRPGFTICS